MHETNAAQVNVYLIAVSDFVVLKDLEDTVRDFDPRGVIVTASGCDDLIRMIEEQDWLTLAFVEAGPTRISEVHLDTLVYSKGGTIVLLGDDAEDEWDAERPAPPRLPTLSRPFSSRNVLSLMSAVAD